jgi:hypothetical protein
MKKLEYPGRTTDHGQATGKLYHLRLRVVIVVVVAIVVVIAIVVETMSVVVGDVGFIDCPKLKKISENS